MQNIFYLRTVLSSPDWLQLVVRSTQVVLSSGPVEQTKRCYQRYIKEFGVDTESLLRSLSKLTYRVSEKSYEQGVEYMDKHGDDLNHILDEWYNETVGERNKEFWSGSKIKRRKKKLLRKI